MCLAIPGRIHELADETGQVATVDVDGVRRKVNVGLVAPDGLEEGDWVLIHVGFAIAKIDEKEAEETYAYLRRLGQEFEDELADLRESDIEGSDGP